MLLITPADAILVEEVMNHPILYAKNSNCQSTLRCWEMVATKLQSKVLETMVNFNRLLDMHKLELGTINDGCQPAVFSETICFLDIIAFQKIKTIDPSFSPIKDPLLVRVMKDNLMESYKKRFPGMQEALDSHYNPDISPEERQRKNQVKFIKLQEAKKFYSSHFKSLKLANVNVPLPSNPDQFVSFFMAELKFLNQNQRDRICKQIMGFMNTTVVNPCVTGELSCQGGYLEPFIKKNKNTHLVPNAFRKWLTNCLRFFPPQQQIETFKKIFKFVAFEKCFLYSV